MRTWLCGVAFVTLAGCVKLSDVCRGEGEFCLAVHVLESSELIEQVEVVGSIVPPTGAVRPGTALGPLTLPASVAIVPRTKVSGTFVVEVYGLRGGKRVTQGKAEARLPGPASLEVRLAGGSVQNADMATVDMVAQKPGCDKAGPCVIKCLDDKPSFTVEECFDECYAASRPGVGAKLDAALNCAGQFCVDRGSCKIENGQLLNLDGTPASTGTACGNCYNNATAALFGKTCTSTSSPTCNPSACDSERDACLNDK